MKRKKKKKKEVYQKCFKRENKNLFFFFHAISAIQLIRAIIRKHLSDTHIYLINLTTCFFPNIYHVYYTYY